VCVSKTGAVTLGLDADEICNSDAFASLSWVKDFVQKTKESSSSLDDLFIDLDGSNEFMNQAAMLPQWSYASCYGGHQFGVFAGQLGDGRCLTIGERQNYELNLKGSGQTQYSRNGDGLVTFRSAAREFLAAEYLHGLNIPTTRSLALWASDLQAWRAAPDGTNYAAPERTGLLARFGTALSLRFGTLELAAARGDSILLNQIVDFALDTIFSTSRTGEASSKRAELVLLTADRTARLAAYFDVFGFVHGVLNTDNFCLAGEALDFGPFAFVETEYDLSPNLSDRTGRYRRTKQVSAFRSAVAHLGDALGQHNSGHIFETLYENRRNELWCARFALRMNEDNARLALTIADAILAVPELDFSNTLRKLILDRIVPLELSSSPCVLEYIDRISRFERDHPVSAHKALEYALNFLNPVFVLRNSVIHDAIESFFATEDPADIQLLIEASSRPFDHEWLQKNLPSSFLEPSVQGRIPGQSLLSCSS